MREYIRVNQLAYDALSKEYDNRAKIKSQYEERPETLGGNVLKYLQGEKGPFIVLEVGPGSGEILLFFEQQGCRTVAVELSNRIADIAQKRSPNTIIILGDILETEFQSDLFDIIYAGALIHLFPLSDALVLLNNFYKWLKPGGILFVNTTTHSSSEEGYFTKVDYGKPIKRFRRKWTENEFFTTLMDSRFEILERLFTDEKDRQKFWLAFLCTKRGANK